MAAARFEQPLPVSASRDETKARAAFFGGCTENKSHLIIRFARPLDPPNIRRTKKPYRHSEEADDLRFDGGTPIDSLKCAGPRSFP